MLYAPLMESFASDGMPPEQLAAATRNGFEVLVPQSAQEASALLDMVDMALTVHGEGRHHFISLGEMLSPGVVVCDGPLGRGLAAIARWKYGNCLFLTCPRAEHSWMFTWASGGIP